MDYYEASDASSSDGTYSRGFTEDSSDQDLISTIDRWTKDSRSFHDLMLLQQNKSVRYYLGDQTDKKDIPVYNSDTVYNRIFEATETLIPIVTGSAHQFIAIPANENEISIKRAQKIQKVLSRKYEDREVRRHLEETTRDIILKRYGVLKWFWNPIIDDVDVATIDPRLLLFPKLKVDANDNLPYILELQEYTKEEISEFFPNVDISELSKGRIEAGFYQNLDVDAAQDIYQVIEAWTPEYVCWKQKGKILKRMPNPYWDFEGEEVEVKDTKANGRIKVRTSKRFYNHLERPTMPYVFVNPFRTGDAPVAETSLAEIAIPIQDDINTQKRAIVDNLRKMGNGQVYIDDGALTEEQTDQITSEPGLVIIGKELASATRIRREPGVPLPGAHFSNMQDSVIAFDNVFGTQAALRGADTSPTLGGQILNRQQNLSRVEEITRALNRGVNRIADGFVQMMKLFYNEEHVIKILGRDGAIEFLKFTRDDIEDGMEIDVKSGTPPILDPVARFNQAIQLWQLNALDPETLFERLEFPDPQTTAQKLFAWKSGQLKLESEIRRGEAAGGMPARETGGAQLPERGIETPADVITRARQALGGEGAAPLTNPPNVTR